MRNTPLILEVEDPPFRSTSTHIQALSIHPIDSGLELPRLNTLNGQWAERMPVKEEYQESEGRNYLSSALPNTTHLLTNKNISLHKSPLVSESDQYLLARPSTPSNQRAPELEPERPRATIDDHFHFWSTYNTVAGSYDQKSIDAWNKSLDVLLMFAGLFSAINTAFIVESYKALQNDPVETTNALLRLLIHRNDSTTLSAEDLNPLSTSPSAVPINSLFFSSLSFSLTAACGAVTAKQWLMAYMDMGTMKAVYVQGRMRQNKHMGLKAWRLRLIIEALPILLQISLLLFLIGVVNFLWVLDQQVGTLQLILSGAGVAVYFITTIIGMFVPNSPFHSRFSSNFRRRIQNVGRAVKESRHRIPFNWLRRNLLRFTTTTVTLFNLTHTLNWLSNVLDHLWSPIRFRILEIRKRVRSVVFGREFRFMEDRKWDQVDITAAESLVWLLEHAEHPDVIITALDAVPRLPPDLLLSLFSKHDGLLERVIQFHNGLLPPASHEPKNKGWVEGWSERAVISGTALLHILKSKSTLPNETSLDALTELIEVQNAKHHPSTLEPLDVAKATLNHDFRFLLGDGQYQSIELYYFLEHVTELSHYSHMVDVGIVDIPGSTSRSSFTTVVSPLQLALDGITCYAWSSHRLEVITMEPGWNLAMEALTSVLRRDLPREIVSHIAITIAVIHWRQMSVDDRNGQFSVEEQEKVTQLLAKRCFDVDKSKSILQNVALALQMTAAIPTQSPNSEARLEISRALFLITCDLFQRTFSGLDTAMHYPYLAEAILRLLDDNGAHHSTIQTHVAQVLPWCPDGDWVSPLHSEFGGELMTLLRSTLKTSSVDPNNPTSSPSSLLLEKMARVLDDSEFLRAIELMVTAKDIKAIRRLVITSYGQFAPEFVIRVVKYGLNDECPTRVSLLEAQVTLVAATLINWRQVWSPVQESVIDFFNHLLAQNTELQWPAYFTFMGLVSSSTSEDYPFPLNSVEPSRIRDVLHGPNWKDDLHQPWCGEAFLLLWRKVKQERTSGNLPSDWCNSLFFGSHAKDMMRSYLKHMRSKRYPGVDSQHWNEYSKAKTNP